MFSHRNVTLLGALIAYVSISALLVLNPGAEIVLFPAYAAIFLWADYRREEEMHIIFVFLVAVAAVFSMARLGDMPHRIGLGLEGLGLGLLSFGLGAHRERLDKERYRTLSAVEVLDVRIRDDERELGFYSTYEQSAVGQILLRRDLTNAAKNLSSTMDPQDAQLRLLRILESRYQGSRIKVMPGEPQDPVVGWAARTKAPVLIRDARVDERFDPKNTQHPFRSAMIVPLNVMKSPYGFVRLESDEPKAYNDEDLRTVDMLATLASLTLENIQLYGEVHNMAIHDSLTQLTTQRAFRQRLKEELLRAGRGQAALALIMCDVDHFKRYNDTYGHQAGDELLRTVARLLVNHTRPVDCVARYGGEEFAVVLPNTTREQALAAAESMRQSIASEPFLFQGQRTSVTMSFGVAVFPDDATSQSQLMRLADERLYVSKNGGRNRVTG